MSQAFTAGAEPEFSLTTFKVRVLLVDDQLLVVEAVRRMLSDQPDIEFHFVTNPAAAIDCAERLQPTVILQDLVMPGWDGFDLIRRYRASAQLEHVPVIVLSARDEAASKAHGFAVGANDYLVKLPDRLELLARVRYHSGAYISRLQRDEAFRFLRESQKHLAEANIELQKLAALDSLTGIANRRRFDETLHHEWQRAQRERRPLSLLLCDIDCFKLYNDTFGHLAGDLCLKKAAAVLTACLKRPADLAARYGGEEFALVLPDTDEAGARSVAEYCLRALAELGIDNPQAPHRIVTMSIGMATLIPASGTAPADLVEYADRALYSAKGDGRNRASGAF
ncbi:diguanylate cyclase domain-containing protein [Pseudoduganella umbonata]|uniref:diguanylate cyclase n=1 Tax=Pseudoduganella umbonata TaxID=864828 RepID=A0A4P8HX13_9BURK|nr:diguanylate cyclase [Pseudoduganella umbonata]MBB3224195.1 two-component system chemotaxis family response regulator WspR [Pseudoduganella umbonata]QCP13946.1 diguanylate cyclase [Pseudoduganella umbonata]